MVASVFYYEIIDNLILQNEILNENAMNIESPMMGIIKNKYLHEIDLIKAKIKELLPLNIPDNDENKIDFLEESLYTRDKLENYHKYSKKNNFSLWEGIKAYCFKLYEKLQHV